MSNTALSARTRVSGPPRKPGTKNKSLAFDWRPIHHKLLLGVYQLYLMTADLLTILYWKKTSQTAVQEELPKLVRHKYLKCFRLLTEEGSGSFVYYLGPSGIEYWRDAGKDMDSYWLPKKSKLPSYPLLIHTLELNTFLAHATAFARMRGIGLEIAHDFALRKLPVSVTISKMTKNELVEEQHEIHADALLTFYLPDNTRRWIWHEHDTGEESQKQVKTKLRGLVSLIATRGYKQFGANGITITVTTSGKRFRLEHLRTWTREILLEADLSAGQDLSGTSFSFEEKGTPDTARKNYTLYFKFTRIPKFRHAQIDTMQLFTGSVWFPAFGPKSSPLFPA